MNERDADSKMFNFSSSFYDAKTKAKGIKREDKLMQGSMKDWSV